MKKKVVAMLLAGLMTVALAACSVEGESSGGGGGSSSDDGEIGKVGFSISTLNNPFFVSMADGAEAKAKELGIDLTVVDAGNDTAKQSSDIEDLIAKGIEVLIGRIPHLLHRQ